MKFSETILQIRETLHLSQMSFAKELGVSFATVNRWENEVQKPSSMAIKMLRDFCAHRGLPLFNIEDAEEDAE